MKKTYLNLAVALIALLAGLARAAEPTTRPAVNLITFGDWGFDTDDRQMVANTMANYVSKSGLQFDAAVLLGDNFRVKLKDTKDPYIAKLFENGYDRQKLNFPFYAALGNHDYEETKADIELAYAREHPESRWKMPAKWYRIDLPESSPLVTLLVLDSDKQALTPEEWAEEKTWLEAQLKTPRAAWTIAAAHHTMFSNGNHGDNGVLQTEWGSLFTKYHVDFYVCGHDHTIQHLEIPEWPISFVIAGGGAAGRKPMLRDQRGPFSKSELGFAHLRFEAETATISLIDGATGETAHQFTRDHSGQVKTLINTASDPATTKPLKVIQGIDDKTDK